MTVANRSTLLRQSIEERIATGKLLPGHPLDETELAKEFNVSRTPIREALIQLASMGLVEVRPRRMAVVADVPAQRLVEMFEVMSEIEAMSARLAARRMSAEEHAQLLAAHHSCREACEANDADEYFYRNEAFHDCIYVGSHNAFLIEQARSLHRRLRPYRRLQLRVRNRVANSYAEHEEVVKALIAGEGERAAELLRNHIMIQGQRFADLIASLSQLSAQGT